MNQVDLSDLDSIPHSQIVDWHILVDSGLKKNIYEKSLNILCLIGLVKLLPDSSFDLGIWNWELGSPIYPIHRIHDIHILQCDLQFFKFVP